MPVCRCAGILCGIRIESETNRIETQMTENTSRVPAHTKHWALCTFYDFIHKHQHRLFPMDHKGIQTIPTAVIRTHTDRLCTRLLALLLVQPCIARIVSLVCLCVAVNNVIGLRADFMPFAWLQFNYWTKRKPLFGCSQCRFDGRLCCCCLIWYGDKLETMKW